MGTLLAVEVERDGCPGVGLVEVRGYVLSGTGAGIVDLERAERWHAVDADADTPGARVWAVLVTLDGKPAGTRRGSTVAACAARAAELLELERAVRLDLERLEVAL